jgi:hypothetical protein
MNGKLPKFTSTWKTIPSPQFDAQPIYRKKLAPPQTFLSAGEADFPVRWIEGGGDWKVARTGRLENLPYATVFTLAHTQPDASQI